MNSLSLRILLFSALLFASQHVDAQITQAELGVNGLTCSQCTRSVEMRIRKLDFVKDVDMNLEHTEGTVYFKTDKKIDLSKVAQAVFDAGFSVRYFKATVTFNHVTVSPNYCLSYDGDNFQFVQVPSEELNGAKEVTLIGNKFMPKKELKKWRPYLKTDCGSSGKTYHVTM